MTEYNPAPSPSGHPLLSGPPTLNEYSPNIHNVVPVANEYYLDCYGPLNGFPAPSA